MDRATQYRLLGAPVLSAHFQYVLVFLTNPFPHFHHLWLNQIGNDGFSHPDTFYWSETVFFFHYHIIAVDSFPWFFFPPCVPLISSDLMDEDSRCPADYQSCQMKARTGRQLADVFYQTHFRWIHTACRHVRLNLSLFAANWNCFL